jgi:hypothetical protein
MIICAFLDGRKTKTAAKIESAGRITKKLFNPRLPTLLDLYLPVIPLLPDILKQNILYLVDLIRDIPPDNRYIRTLILHIKILYKDGAVRVVTLANRELDIEDRVASVFYAKSRRLESI